MLGSVRDRNQEPISNARVTLYTGRNPENYTAFINQHTVVRSGRDGSFVIHLQGPFDGWLVVERDGYSRLVDRLNLQKESVEYKNYILFEAAKTLFGKITERKSGAPVAGAEVYTMVVVTRTGRQKTSGILSLRAVHSDSRGYYQIENPPIGEIFYVIAGGPEYLPEKSSKVFFEKGETEKRVDLAVRSARTLNFLVTDQNGKPIEKAQIQTQFSFPPSSTDPNGLAKVAVSGNLSRADTAQVSAEGYLDKLVALQANRTDFSVVLEEAPALSGWIFNQEGEAIEGATIGIWSGDSPRDRFSSARSGENGFFQIRPYRLPLQSVWVQHEEYLGIELDPLPASFDTELEIVLEQGSSSIRGRVTDSNGKIVQRFKVTCRRTGSESHQAGSLNRIFSSSKGEFNLSGLPEGLYEIYINSIPEDLHLMEGTVIPRVEVGSDTVVQIHPIQLESIEKRGAEP